MEEKENKDIIPSAEEKTPAAKTPKTTAAKKTTAKSSGTKTTAAAKTTAAKKTASTGSSAKKTASAAKTSSAKKTTSAASAKADGTKKTTAKTTAKTAAKTTAAKTTAAKKTTQTRTAKSTSAKTAAKEPSVKTAEPETANTVQTPEIEPQTPETDKTVLSAEQTATAEIAAAETVETAEKVQTQPEAATETAAIEAANGETTAQAQTANITQDGGEKADAVDIETVTSRSLSPTRLVLKRFFRSKLSMTGLIMLIVLFAFSFLGPCLQFLPFVWGEQEKEDEAHAVITEYTTPITLTDENGKDVLDEDGNPITIYVVTFTPKVTYLPPSGRHWLGTDSMGYDVFSRLMYGGRISLTIGFVVVILETLLGVLFGGLAGYFGKWVDQIIMRIVDVFNCIPTFPMLMIVGVALQQQGMADVPRLYTMMAMLTLFGWSGTARLVRGQILSLREQEFMLSAEASGLPVRHKIIKHLIPNVMPQLIVSMTLGLGGIILTEATLGYLGIGLPNAYATWGNMISGAANNTVLNYYPNLWIAPGICIIIAVLAFNFIGDGLRDAFDPKSSK